MQINGQTDRQRISFRFCQSVITRSAFCFPLILEEKGGISALVAMAPDSSSFSQWTAICDCVETSVHVLRVVCTGNRRDALLIHFQQCSSSFHVLNKSATRWLNSFLSDIGVFLQQMSGTLSLASTLFFSTFSRVTHIIPLEHKQYGENKQKQRDYVNSAKKDRYSHVQTGTLLLWSLSADPCSTVQLSLFPILNLI